MKFLPEQKNKQLWSFGLLLVAVAGIVYFNFFGSPAGSGKLRPASENYPPAVTESATPAGSGTAPAKSKPVIRKSVGGLLPYGVSIDLGILDDDLFKLLKGASALVVKEEELGKDNLFSK